MAAGYEIHHFVKDGVRVVETWLLGLKDKRAAARVIQRLDRLELGNLGDVKALGQGVSELRIDVGPGYRVYFGMIGKRFVLLLCGGDKRTQQEDIARAIQYFQEYKGHTSCQKIKSASRIQ